MARVDMCNVDLEAGARAGGHSRRCSGSGSSEEGSVCFSDADDGSCYSQFYSTADGSNYDDYSFACATESEIGPESRRVSSVAESDDCSVDLENGVGETKLHVGKIERDCRICHLSLLSSGPESGVAIELGCSCKDDLAAAHKHCAEAWFKIKGNKTCEICCSIARNVVGPNDVESAQQTNESNALATNAASAPVSSATSETRTCLNGHRFLNFLLACMVFAFVISWLFHFNIPS
ncbi:uncharacterized protein LOC107803800 [Nicotiana tabacum]|uniref:Uncharacterized protein LOC107803800 n=2 Tax=Nicotiana TaxID=4085 RepID=A0A1S4B2L7_TOBAC|nr:PREDICTED: uncharacterized protein LOC104232280 [Nicotiana sylvestris]XP_016483071.1 PREDICTED: uncharacterized protein LOC107803800 [Nicotiana tabacum]